MSVVNDITVVGTGLRGRCVVFPSGQCNLLPLGLVVIKQGETVTLRVNRIGKHASRCITISEVSEFPGAFASMVDHLSIISAESEMEGKLHWRSSVGNSLAKYRLNGYMLITPQFYKRQWGSVESLREILGYSYPEEILPFWGRPNTEPTTDREAGRRYFSKAIEHLLETYTRRELSRQTGVADQIISRLRYHGNITHDIYSCLAPTLEQHGFDPAESERHLVLALSTKEIVATADQQTRIAAEALTSLRILSGYTAERMAQVIGIHAHTYHQLEVANMPTSKRTLDLVLEHFNSTEVGIESFNTLVELHAAI